MKRFYLTLMLYDLWRQKSLWEVAEKFDQPRGFIQNLLSSTASFGSCVYHFCQVTLVTLQVVLLKLSDVHVYMSSILLIFLLTLTSKSCLYSFLPSSRMYLAWGKFKIFSVKTLKRCPSKWYNT